MHKGVKDLVTEASNRVTTYTVDEVWGLLGDGGVVLVDVRDLHELQETGTLPGAVHASRGLLEFYIDASTPYHMDVFDSDREFVFYCKSGGRSALAAQRALEMGLERVATMEGGMLAWKTAGAPTVPAPVVLA